jgi:Flp pilus assembly protein TadG
MSTKLNAEELAKLRFAVVKPKPSFSNAMTDAHLLALAQEAQRTGYAAAIREVAQPIANERDEYRQMLQDIAHADNCDETSGGEIYWSEAVSPVVAKVHAILAKYPKQQ